jgi:shikimate kinase
MTSPKDHRLLFLIGARGTGKTTVARLLAERLGWRWCDADTLLEERAGRTIREVFAEEGESGFRDRESAVLSGVVSGKDQIVATGGGVVLRPENRAVLRRGLVAWLSAPPEVLWKRIQEDAGTSHRRPNLAQGGLAEIEDLLHIRTPLYEACADVRIETADRSPEEVAAHLLSWMGCGG